MKRYISELLGTMVLVLFGCGSAAIAGSMLGTVGIALAFGLSIVAMAYVIGDISRMSHQSCCFNRYVD